MTNSEFKQSMMEIMADGCVLPEGTGMTYADYAPLMLQNIGDVDPEFRDGANYEVFCQWTLDGSFMNDELREYLKICLDDRHIMYRVGEYGKDSVYTRTFSALFIAAILERNETESFLTSELLHRVKDRLIEYYDAEVDLRGYTIEGGWAHSAAHAADAIDKLMLCPEMDKCDIMELLFALGRKFDQGRYVFVDREPERICICVRHAIERDLLSDKEIEDWLSGVNEEYVTGSSTEVFHRFVNKQNFMKTLYFALKGHGVRRSCVELIESFVSTL